MAAHSFSTEPLQDVIEARLIEDVERKREDWKKSCGPNREILRERFIAALELLNKIGRG